MADLECPYCDSSLDVCHDDWFGYEENILHQMECKYCGKSFVFETYISFHYSPSKADCLNDGKHIWKPSRTYPIQFTRMVCQTCGDERTPTVEEMALIINK